MVDNVLARLAVEIDAKLAPLQGQLRQVETAMQRTTRVVDTQAKRSEVALAGLNRALSGVAVGLGALGAFAIGRGLASLPEAAAEAERQVARLEGVIEATGGAANRTVQDIEALSREIGQTTLASTQQVRDAAAQLLTFKSVSEDTFDTALRLAQDLSEAGFGSIETTALQLGKALQDPVRGLTALGRAGVTFTDDQRDLVKSLVETNQLAEAQGIILEEVAGQVGGVAVAAAQGYAGAVDSASESVRIFQEELGARLLPSLTGLQQTIGATVRFLTENLDTALVGVEAAVTGLGAALTTALLPAILRSTTAVIAFTGALATNPLFLAATAVGALAAAYVAYADDASDASRETRALQDAVDDASAAEAVARKNLEGLSGAALQNAQARLKQAEATRVAAQAEAAFQQAIQASIAVDEARARLNDPVAAGITGPGAIASIEVTERLTKALEDAQDEFFKTAGEANKLKKESEALESEVAKLAITLGEPPGSGASGAAKAAEEEFKVLGLTVADVPEALAPLRRHFDEFDQRIRDFEVQPFLNALEDIQGALTEVFEDALRGSIDSLKDFGNSVLDILARLGANLLSQKLVIPITVAAGGALGVSAADLGVPEGASTSFGGALDAITGVGSGLFESFATTGIGQALGLSSAVSTLPGQASQFALTGLGSTLSSVAGFGLPILGAAIPLLTSFFGPNPPSNAVATQLNTASGAARVVDPDGEFSDENLARSREIAEAALAVLNRISNATGVSTPFREVAGDVSDRDGEILRLTGANTPGGRIDQVVEGAEDITRTVFRGFVEQVEGLGPQLQAAIDAIGDPLEAEIGEIERFISGAEIFTSIKAQLDSLDQETAGPFETTLTGLQAQWEAFRVTLEAANLPTERLNTLIAATTEELRENFITGLERANRELSGNGFINQILDGVEAFRSQFSDADFLGEGGELVRENLELALNNALASLDLSQLETLEAALLEVSDGTELYGIALREVAEAQEETLIASLRAAQATREVAETTDIVFESARQSLEDLAETTGEVAESADRAALAVDALAERFSTLDEIQEGLLARTQGEAAARDFRLVSAGLGEFTDELRDLAGSGGIGAARAQLEDFIALIRSASLTSGQLETAAEEAFGVFDSLTFEAADAAGRAARDIEAEAREAYGSFFEGLNSSLISFTAVLSNNTESLVARLARTYDEAIRRAEESIDRAAQARGIAQSALLDLSTQQSNPLDRFNDINSIFQDAAGRAASGDLGSVNSLARLTPDFLDALGGEFRRGTPEFFEGFQQAQDALRSAEEAAAEQEAAASARRDRLLERSAQAQSDVREIARETLAAQTTAYAQLIAESQAQLEAVVAAAQVDREEAARLLAEQQKQSALLARLASLTQAQLTRLTSIEENAA